MEKYMDAGKGKNHRGTYKPGRREKKSFEPKVKNSWGRKASHPKLFQ